MKVARLGDVADVIAGQSPPGDTYNRAGIGLPFFQGKADFGPVHPVARMWCTVPERVALPGDVLVSVRAPVGPSNIADVTSCIGRGLAAIRARPGLDPNYLSFFVRSSERELVDRGSGSTFSAITRRDLESLLIAMPTANVQRRIVARLSQDLVLIDRLKALAESRRGAAAIAVSTLVTTATARAYERRPVVSLGEVIRVLSSTSTVSDGDAEVLTVTSGCLTPAGFLPDGLRPNRMRRQDVDRARVAAGEILVSRSNTEELVGRTARYSGNPPGVVATDLVFRVIVDESKADGAYVSAILAGVQLQGYWKQRSSGASSTMKKITKVQLGDVVIPLPPLPQQRKIAASLGRHLQEVGRALRSLSAEVEAARALSTAILIREFGALSSGQS